MTKRTPKPQISSFVVPTAQDLAGFKALRPNLKRQIIEAELAKAFTGRVLTLKPDLIAILRDTSIKRLP